MSRHRSPGLILEQLRQLSGTARAQLEQLEAEPWRAELAASATARARNLLEQLERAELAGRPSEPLTLAQLELVLGAECDPPTAEPTSAAALAGRDSDRKAGYPLGRCLPNGGALRLLP